MANLNAGVPNRFENGGVLKIGADIVLSVVAGTLKWKVPGRQPIQHMDRGILGAVVAGDQRPCEVEFKVKCTPLSHVGTNSLGPAINGALSSNRIVNHVAASGLINTVTIVADFLDALGSATGTRVTFAACYLENAEDMECKAGADFDELTLKFMDAESSPTVVAF